MVRKFQARGGRYGAGGAADPNPRSKQRDHDNNKSSPKKTLNKLNPDKSPRPPNRHDRVTNYDRPRQDNDLFKPPSNVPRRKRDKQQQQQQRRRRHHHTDQRLDKRRNSSPAKFAQKHAILRSRREISVVNMNMNGKAVMGKLLPLSIYFWFINSTVKSRFGPLSGYFDSLNQEFTECSDCRI